MFDLASIIAGLVKLGNLIAGWLRDKELVESGKTIQQGENDAATIENVKKASAAKSADNAALDDELLIP